MKKSEILLEVEENKTLNTFNTKNLKTQYKTTHIGFMKLVFLNP